MYKGNFDDASDNVFYLSSSDYYIFAISLVSGLSKYGEKNIFEINDAMVKNRKETDAVCVKFCLLMDILFSKMSTKKFLLDDKQNNIFRIAHCNVKYEKGKTVLSTIFSRSPCKLR